MRSEILIFGGSGKLGRALKEREPHAVSLSHARCDITDLDQAGKVIAKYCPEIVIQAAALVGTRECEENKELAWWVNVEGTVNIAKICRNQGARLIFISSAAIFDGRKGKYKESDPPSPIFYYAVTKTAAEQAVKVVPDHAIIRLDFFPATGPKHYKVFTDHYTGKIPVSEAAEKVLVVARSSHIGVINVGRGRDSLFNILKPYYPQIKPITIAESTLPGFPRDISLDLALFNNIFGKEVG